MKKNLKKFITVFSLFSVLVWSNSAVVFASQSTDNSEKPSKKELICHQTGDGQIDIEVAEESVAAHLEHGDSIGNCPPPPPVEVIHGEWCSALIGVMSSSSLQGNNVVDVNDDGIIRDLTDIAIASEWYDTGNNKACLESFGPSGEFTKENYLEIDWCNGLVKGITDSIGSLTGDARYSSIFDLNDDGAINLTDVAMVATYGNNQAACYPNYGFPAWPEDPEEPVIHGEWCSALLGMFESNTLQDNQVIDLNDDGFINLSDTALMAQWYDNGDNSTCYARLETSEDHFNFNQENYQQIDWCNGLVQGIRDSIGSHTGDARYSSIFDLNDDGVINLTDVAIVATLVSIANQATCYNHYVPPMPEWSVPEAYCGNGVVEAGEQCDSYGLLECTTEAGYAGTRTCNMPPVKTLTLQSVEPSYCVFNSCVSQEYCGDEIINGNEECDAGREGSDTCTAQCTLIENPPAPICGNNIVEANEVCDDGNIQAEMCGDSTVQNGTYCNATCTEIVTLAEQCDAGSEGSETCTAQCTLIENPPAAFCGNGTVDPGEQCDAGPNGNSTCTVQCTSISSPSGGGGGGGGGGGIPQINIFNIQVATNTTTAKLTWETTRSSLTWMLYGTSTAYGQEYKNNAYSSTHGLELTNLLPNTTYHYQLRAADSNLNTAYDVDRTFVTNGNGIPQQVLGEKVYACVPDIDGDVKSISKFADGVLLRGCGPEVYHIINGKKFHIPNWQYLHDNYFGIRIYNISDDVLVQFPDTNQDNTNLKRTLKQVLGKKVYGNGTLLRGSDQKIYVIVNGAKVHIKSLEDLKKYTGHKIFDVSDEVLNQY